MKTAMDKKEQKVSSSSVARMAPAPTLAEQSLPQAFVVKSLGKREARGLWGVKQTRGPVDDMVVAARSQKPGSFLPFLQLRVAYDGVTVSEMPQNQNKDFDGGPFPVDVISYGVQDVVYTRVFAMIVVRSRPPDELPSRALAAASPASLECHAFVCDSRQSARQLTFALASAFKAFSKSIKGRTNPATARKFAIDLRSPEEIQAELDSEA